MMAVCRICQDDTELLVDALAICPACEKAREAIEKRHGLEPQAEQNLKANQHPGPWKTSAASE
jgi:hypothetical protein